jgi:hypothetical protein
MFLKASGFYCYATQSENFLNHISKQNE